MDIIPLTVSDPDLVEAICTQARPHSTFVRMFIGIGDTAYPNTYDATFGQMGKKILSSYLYVETKGSLRFSGKKHLIFTCKCTISAGCK
jgi:hypothetical protein